MIIRVRGGTQNGLLNPWARWVWGWVGGKSFTPWWVGRLVTKNEGTGRGEGASGSGLGIGHLVTKSEGSGLLLVFWLVLDLLLFHVVVFFVIW